MSIVRAPRPDRGFSIVRDSVARDARLSYRARGLLVAILSRPAGWRTDSAQLAKEGTEGREAIRAAMRELEAVGYLRRERRRGDRGQWVTETLVFDEPGGLEAVQVSDITAGGTGDGFLGAGDHDGTGGKPAGRTRDGFPGVGQPGVGNPDVGGLGAIEATERANQSQNLSATPAGAVDPLGTEELPLGLGAAPVAERDPVQELTAYYAECAAGDVPGTHLAAVGRNLKTLIKVDGMSPEALRPAVAEAARRGQRGIGTFVVAPTEARGASRPSTTDQRFNDALLLARQLHAEEQGNPGDLEIGAAS